MPDLETRIRRLEDRAAINDLVLRYFIAADDDDLDTLGSSFTADGEFVISGVEAASDRNNIVRFIQDDRAHMGVTVHTQNFTLITWLEDDWARGIVGAHLELARAGTTVYGAVRYHDNYRRTNQGWKIARRDMATIHMGSWDDVATSLTTERRARWPGQDPMPADLPPKRT